MGKLDGKVAVITGAGSGMGRAAAVLFAQEGASVVCADISGAEKQTADLIGESAVPVRADVSQSDDVIKMIDTAEQRWGGLDVLFNNAGFGGPIKPIAEQTEENFDNVVATNLRGVFLGMKYGIAAMLRRGGGSVVNTASAVALVGFKGHSAYAASKAGVVQMTKCAALDYAEEGVRVNAICPGMTWTGLVPTSVEHPVPPPGMRAPQPMGRWGLAEEIAAVALFLASDEASLITGAAIPVDGGFAIGWNTQLG